MPYSNIRAGLVALVFALIISLVSAIPIPATASGLSSSPTPRSNPSLYGRQFDNSEISSSGRMSTLPFVTRRALKQDILDDNNQLVRRGVAAKVKADFQKVAHVFKEAGQAIKHEAKKIVDKVVTGVKHEAKVIVKDIKKDAVKVGKFLATTGKEVAKVATKAYSVVLKIGSKVANFIPVVGKVVSKVMDGESKVVNAASNAIKAPMTKAANKAFNVLGKIGKGLGYVPR